MISTGQRWINKDDPKHSILIVAVKSDDMYLVYSTKRCNTIEMNDVWIKSYYKIWNCQLENSEENR